MTSFTYFIEAASESEPQRPKPLKASQMNGSRSESRSVEEINDSPTLPIQAIAITRPTPPSKTVDRRLRRTTRTDSVSNTKPTKKTTQPLSIFPKPPLSPLIPQRKGVADAKYPKGSSHSSTTGPSLDLVRPEYHSQIQSQVGAQAQAQYRRPIQQNDSHSRHNPELDSSVSVRLPAPPRQAHRSGDGQKRDGPICIARRAIKGARKEFERICPCLIHSSSSSGVSVQEIQGAIFPSSSLGCEGYL